MPHYVVERTFRDSWDIGADGEERCRQIIAGNGDDVTWLHSYVSEDGRKSFCMYEAPSPEAIRKSRPATTCRSTRSRPSVSSIRTPTGQHHHVENDADEIVGAAGGLQWGSALDGSRVYTANANSLSIPWSLVGGGGTTTNGVWSGLDAATGGIIWQQTRSHGGSTSGPVTPRTRSVRREWRPESMPGQLRPRHVSGRRPESGLRPGRHERKLHRLRLPGLESERGANTRRPSGRRSSDRGLSDCRREEHRRSSLRLALRRRASQRPDRRCSGALVQRLRPRPTPAPQ
jgi:hypothetical protein